MSPRIVVLGDLNVDIVAVQQAPLAADSDTPARVSMRPGGGGANVAAWLARQDVAVTLIGRLGTDALAEVALSGLDGVDLHVARDRKSTTGTCIVLVAPGGGRTMLPDPGANDALTVEDLPSELEGDILHVSGYALMRPGSRAAAMAAIDRARDAGLRISVDPASAAPLANDPVFLQRIAPIDLLLPNADEAGVLGPQIDVPEVVIKHGGGGATWTDGVESVTQPALPTDVVDTTGAGDAFAAGFLSRWLSGEPGAALRAGAECAALAVARIGSRA